MAKKVNLGSKLALYPTPVTVIGADVDGKVNWLLIAHTGIVSHDRVLVSMSKLHFTTHALGVGKRMSMNLVSQAMLPKADHVGCVSGEKEDKSHEFEYHRGEGGTPVIDDAPLTMELEVVDVYECNGFDNFICSIVNTYVNEENLDESGKIDYNRMHTVLFEFPTYSYLLSGDIIGKCRKMQDWHDKTAE
ncbi:MAG: flavin reductase family protein [Muribaculaceae bacterium]|nr:flavin reductase family protein [Muribaculaceae bacterium]